MALKTIKQIINSKGYVINPKDRAIFETGDLRSFFGLSNTDAIEFIVYDVNDNQLPQSADGSLVRYVPLTSETISDYILIPEGTIIQKYTLPTEYFIDVERLLGEAGYGNGIFKTQITLVNKRVGSEMKDDKLYINEISPSRTEVRLFPVMRSSSDAVKQNLRERFNIFINDGTFRDDVVTRAIEYVEQIKPTEISSFIISKYGESWLTNFKSEYKITDFDSLMTRIYNTFVQSCIYELTDKISDINDSKYGKPKGIQQPLSLTPSNVKNRINILLVEALNKYIPIADVRTTTSEVQTLESRDEIIQIVRKKESDLVIDVTPPVREVIEVKKKPILDKDVVFEKKVKKQLPTIELTDVQAGVKTPKPLPSLEAPNPKLEADIIEAPTFSGGGGSTRTTYVVDDPNDRRGFRPEVDGNARPRDNAQQ
jgi:hypothetical protein